MISAPLDEWASMGPGDNLNPGVYFLIGSGTPGEYTRSGIYLDPTLKWSYTVHVFPIKSFYFLIFHKCSHIPKTKGATDKRHTLLESASLSASIYVVIKSSCDCHMEINIIKYY